MVPATPYRIREKQLWLTAEGCIFWESQQALILSDLHFGKTGHFRKYGIAVPQAVYREDLQRLLTQIQYFQPRQLIVVGDLFHSRANKELELFLKWRDNFAGISIHLIKGNHDMLHEDWYTLCDIGLNHPKLLIEDLCFIHDINDLGRPLAPAEQRSAVQSVRRGKSDATLPLINYVFSGHLHPGIRISGAGKQSLCFPCFYFGEKHAVIPAFSRFTGVALIQPRKNENVFAIVDNRLMQLQ